MQCKWMLRRSSVDIKRLAKEAKISETVACILVNRGIANVKEIQKFVKADFNDFHNPLSMKDMDKGTDIMKNAIEKGKRIVVYGDYDVDGVVSTYILYSTLLRCGANVGYYIPNRETEGYGMNSDRIKLLKEEGYEVIISCDNGISALEQISLAKDLGMTVVITDHHDVPFVEDEKGERIYKVPKADAVINPKQFDCKYPFKLLCGAGVVLKFSEVIYNKFGIDKNEVLNFIEYAAIATICDVVDILDENRVIVKNGLKKINDTENIGLKALIKETSMENKKISTYHIGFIIGPCINATGRLDTASLAVKLLLSKNKDEAEELAKKLVALNKERQEMTTESVENIVQIIENNNMLKDKVLVVYSEEVHESIAGIVAGRVKEKYNLPTIVLTKGKEMPKGSARSIDEYNMFEELIKCKDLLSKFGGHPMAAGLSLKEENISLLRERLNKNCKLRDDDIIPKIRIDKRLLLNEVDFNLIKDLNILEPFGKGNSSPVFAEKNIFVTRAYLMGKEKNVLKLFCKANSMGAKLDAISFDGVDKFREMVVKEYGEDKYLEIINTSKANLTMDMIFYPSINEYSGNTTIQLYIKDFRKS